MDIVPDVHWRVPFLTTKHKHTMTIQEIKELDDNTVIPDFSATLQFVNEPRGKVQQCKLKDETGDIKMILITRPPVSADLQGKLVKVQGALSSLDTYTGIPVPQVKLLPKGKLIFDPRGSVRTELPVSEPPTKVNGFHSPSAGGNSQGQRAGMCVKGALDIIIAGYKQGDYKVEFFGKPEFGNLLRTLASDICRASEDIEAHKLAPTAKDREELVEPARDKVIQAAEELFTGDQG